MNEPLVIEGTVVIPAADLSWTAVRSGGPGGQNVNKVASKVVLRFALANSAALTSEVKARLRALAGSRLTEAGEIIVTSQAGPDQRQNLEDARAKLRQLVVRALHPPRPRRPTRPTRASQARRLDTKKRHGAKKQTRRCPPGED
ncbi:MAG: aminoacyl-tRNA hydrolase [Candidatus Ozemobacter sibiricus]|uniref:Aminoacyl-tRNA hydrolase n=1 Tax=Candidatus Ozemobacter sibiricus TaxID=2268124 RepID=A0A367ZNZ3_9BACT|nr:MAG: aminoacyl-tRNA hydrolase [Candidatus Ozemobacter sibiricus]